MQTFKKYVKSNDDKIVTYDDKIRYEKLQYNTYRQ